MKQKQNKQATKAPELSTRFHYLHSLYLDLELLTNLLYAYHPPKKYTYKNAYADIMDFSNDVLATEEVAEDGLKTYSCPLAKETLAVLEQLSVIVRNSMQQYEFELNKKACVQGVINAFDRTKSLHSQLLQLTAKASIVAKDELSGQGGLNEPVEKISLSLKEVNVLIYCSQNPMIEKYQVEIEDGTGYMRKTIRGYIDRLLSYNLLARPIGKKQSYKITQKGLNWLALQSKANNHST